MGRTCQICGKPSGKYPLCYNCSAMKNKGEIIKCEICGQWHLLNEPCICKKQKPNGKCLICNKPTFNSELCEECISKHFDENNIAVEIIKTYEEAHKTTTKHCMLCGKEIEEGYFCNDCKKTKLNEQIKKSIEQLNYKEIEKLYTKGKFLCNDGHIVRSKDEKMIDDFLFNNSILHCYEYEYHVKDNIYIHPDFYLPKTIINNKNVIIEHWGIENNSYYDEAKEFKKEIYKAQDKYTLIETTRDDLGNIEKSLKSKLNIEG